MTEPVLQQQAEETEVKPSTLRSRRRRALMTPNQRTREQARFAARRRNDLVELLAPDLRCAECGEQFPGPEHLQVDHVDGRSWCVDDYSPHQRHARYWREYEAGEPLRALCGLCNATDGGGRRYGYDRRRK